MSTLPTKCENVLIKAKTKKMKENMILDYYLKF